MPSRSSAHLLKLLLNSAVAFAIADTAMITVHEFGHALAGIAIGLHPIVYPGQVLNAAHATATQQVIQLVAGPLVSLVTGLTILALVPAARGFAQLLLLWFGALSVQEFTGYLMTGPFLQIGDIGSALQLFTAPRWVYWLLFVVGVFGTLLLGRHFTARLVALVDLGSGDRSAQLRCLGLLAWLLGAAVILGYGLADGLLIGDVHSMFTSVGLVEALATLTSGIFVFAVRFFMGATVRKRPMSVGLGWPLAGAIIFVVLNVGRSLILGPGLQM